MDLPSSASICQCCSGVVPNGCFSGVSAILFSSFFCHRVVIVMWCCRPCSISVEVLSSLVAAGDADPAIRDGVQMIHDQLVGVLKESGVEPVDALGETFDPNLHEAISQKHTAEAEEGTVLQQVQRGYKLNDRLVRPARVIVAAAPAVEVEPTES